jgi:tRNA(fMet)-specific endonuclease VapC
LKEGYLLDTNVLSEPLMEQPSARVLERIRRLEDRLFTSSIVWHELRYGAQRMPRTGKRSIVERYLDTVVGPNVPILPYDDRAAAWHAAERARLEKKGKTPAFSDGQIAATAAVNGLVLVTRNTKHFKVFNGLDVENWHC